ncbi:hypothetical protein ABIB62_004239 [Mucilaginibacter sp. UYP25]|uniref:hypothetical protein n=1 Tax=unclassified Mucilaginibacter TaxID=2617802 RepID=UPI0033994DFF
MKSLIFYIITCCLFITFEAFAQNEGPDYCHCRVASSKILVKNNPDKGFYAKIRKKESNLKISFYNPTVDTLYLFSSYLQHQFISSKYIHRIDRKHKIYKISFLPLVPRLYVKYSDNVINDNAIVSQNQVVYNFIKFPPLTKIDIELPYDTLFSHSKEIDNVSEDYNVKSLNKYSKSIPFKPYTFDLFKSNYQLNFEFAIYKSVNLLCNEKAFYLQEAAFDQQSKSFQTIKLRYNVKLIKENPSCKSSN